VFSQEIRRISKSVKEIQEKNYIYVNAIKSSGNTLNKEVAYNYNDSILFLKELDSFFVAFEKKLINEGHSINFAGNNRKMNYVLFIGNAGYIDAFYYDFEDGKLKLSFVGILSSFVANYKWENSQKARMVHKSSYDFK